VWLEHTRGVLYPALPFRNFRHLGAIRARVFFHRLMTGFVVCQSWSPEDASVAFFPLFFPLSVDGFPPPDVTESL